MAYASQLLNMPRGMVVAVQLENENLPCLEMERLMVGVVMVLMTPGDESTLQYMCESFASYTSV
jgi:hypothetical protein